MGVVYYDYTPANLLFENNQVFLVDPPDVLRHGVLLWDFSYFRSSVRRHLWSSACGNPLIDGERSSAKA